MNRNEVETFAAGLNCFGCTVWILGVIVFFFVVTHVGPIWHALTRLVGS